MTSDVTVAGFRSKIGWLGRANRTVGKLRRQVPAAFKRVEPLEPVFGVIDWDR